MSEDREQRNAVFTGAPGGVDPRIQSFTATEKAKADFGLDIPVEVVPLPSAGRVYPQGHPLFNKEVIEIRAMTAREEDILTSKALLKKGTVITELIRSCLVDKQVDPLELLTGDRNALMVAIRITGYGADYDAEVECNECNVKSPVGFNLGELPIQPLGCEPVSPGINAFEFKLPMSKKLVKFRFMTGKDEEVILQTAERQKKAGLPNDFTVTTNLLYSIVSIDGIEDRNKISSFVKVMPARDSLALRNYIRDHEPGIRMKQEVSCPACGHTAEVTMPIGTSFLWPSAGR